MDILHKIYTAAKATPIDSQELENASLNRFFDLSLKSAELIMQDDTLKTQATHKLSSLLESQKPTDTLPHLDQVFESATQACHHERERELMAWLKICVTSIVSKGLNQESTSRAVKGQTKKTIRHKSEEESEYSESEYDTEISWDEDEDENYEVIGSSDDDYVPSEDDHVPTKKYQTRSRKVVKDTTYKLESDEDDEEYEDRKSGRKTTKTTKVTKTTKTKVSTTKVKKEQEDDQVVPCYKPSPAKRIQLKSATFPVIDEGVGPKALVKYYNDIKTNIVDTQSVLSNGHFVRSFFFPSRDSFNAFLSALNSATKTIDICVFAFTDDDVVATLTAAKDRGVKIKVITDNQQAAGKGADVKRLQEEHGIPFRTDKTQGYMHNKFAIIDSATLINGSFNWSKGARFKNKENIIITNIPTTIKEFQAQFDSLWEEFA